MIRTHYEITGIVQGVGFRPFVYRIAHDLNLTGWVRNTPSGVELEVQGGADRLTDFEDALQNRLPPLAVVTSQTSTDAITIDGESSFIILPSGSGRADIQIAPDTAICSDCLIEMNDPADRRYRYPFITCTNCGPRYSIITGTPYDRPKTTMVGFPLCPDCRSEYQNPLDRRFHAQPIACHVCGPQMKLLRSPLPSSPSWGEEHNSLPQRGRVGEWGGDAAIVQAIQLLKSGAILAIKGIGGYHLAVDACNHAAVERLRERKKRDEKPFAVMSASLEVARELACMSDMEERLLTSPEAPIVIVRKRLPAPLSPLIAPNNGWLGLMLPYAPLHQLLFKVRGSRFKVQGSTPATMNLEPRTGLTALVMTSGNISDEPVVFEDHDALTSLAGIADYFLLHDRPIHIRCDDSVLRVFQGKPLFYRRARGYAPRAVKLPFPVRPLLATGAELKSVICLAAGDRAVLSQHIGDLKNIYTFDSFVHTVTHLSDTLEIKPELIASDLHPDYLSSRFAENSGLPCIQVQHHHAHLASCMAENNLDGDVIGIIFDGTGYGPDGTIWGGEFLVGGYDGYQRAGHFRPVPMPGGDAAVREPWRMALAYLYKAVGEDAFSIDHPVTRRLPKNEQILFAQMLKRGINSPLTSSCGRLFDAVAALLNIRHVVSYDGQGAIELEAVAEIADQGGGFSYKVEINDKTPLQLDFSPMFIELLHDINSNVETSAIAHRFHRTVASAATDICLRIAESTGLDRIILSGGVFQNRLLSEMIYTALTDLGLQVFSHRLVPPNDGGIALGQAAIAGRRKN
ncbi:MAG TPA: carbamoyltransferase HypF [Desulfuromonadales bacterium]|nr:carbamoyltransferase HypF [Desulfuromonadales bacterium]